jgi:hypothetical protein
VKGCLGLEVGKYLSENERSGCVGSSESGSGLHDPFRIHVSTFHRHPPPTAYSPSTTLSIPSTDNGLNPLSHLFHSILCQLTPREMVARWLHPDCSPSSGDFLPSEVLGLNSGSSSMQTKSVSRSTSSSSDMGVLAQSLTLIMLQLGRTKQIGMGWEDKEAFLDFWKEKNRRTIRTTKASDHNKGKKRR